MDAVTRFRSKVNADGPPHPYDVSKGPCWVWTAATNEKGYGAFAPSSGRRVLAHRYAYETFVGPIPDGLVVKHSCDNPPCVNPLHLSTGTQAENLAEAVARGRNRGTSRPGVLNPAARLTAGIVAAIRRDRSNGASLNTLMARYGVSKSQTHRIITGQSWPDTEGAHCG